MKQLLVVVLALCMAVYAQDLQTLLQETGATWTAESNAISEMSEIEFQNMLSVLPGVYDYAELPEDEMVDFVDNERGAFEARHTSVKNQGSCGSCYAFGACATYESNALVKTGRTYDLSEQDFMMKAKAQGPYGGCNGWWLDKAMELLKNKGVTSEAKCPYKAKEEACPATGNEYKISSYGRTTDLNTIKAKLQSCGALYCAFMVYNDFRSYKSGVYRYTSGSRLGGHAVTLVGYDDAKQAFKVKNSWGTGWGENGYFWIGYDQMNNCVQFANCNGGAYYIIK